MLTLYMNSQAGMKHPPKYWSNVLESLAKTRDQRTFARLHNHFTPLIRSFFQSKQTDYTLEATDELVQEVMLKVWLKADSFDSSKAAASTWIFTLARNVRIDYIRKNAKHYENKETLTTEDIFDSEDEHTPFTYLHQSREASELKLLLSEIPRKQSQCLKKMYMEGKSHSEISNEMGLPLGTVKSRVRLALKRLQTKVRPV